MDYETFFNLPNPEGSIAWQYEQKGKAVGKAEGLAEGKAVGKAEAKTEIAMILLFEGFTRKKVAALTGLSTAQVKIIQKKYSGFL